MPLAPDRLSGVRAKMDRAKEHIRDLESRINAFRQQNPYWVACHKDAQNGEHVFTAHHFTLPLCFSVLAGEAVHQLRSSFDHLAWQLVVANGGSPGDKTSFPICTPAAYSSANTLKKTAGMSAGARSLVENVQPYQQGYSLLGTLSELDNINKHRFLPVVAQGLYKFGVAYMHSSSGVFEHPDFRKLFSRALQLDPRPMAGPDQVLVVHNGAEIGRISWPGGPAPNPSEKLDLGYDIALSEPAIVRGYVLVPFLRQLFEFAQRVIDQFIPFI